ncbi:MAG: hypothetical protein ABW039_03675 [Sphingobium sp.]
MTNVDTRRTIAHQIGAGRTGQRMGAETGFCAPALAQTGYRETHSDAGDFSSWSFE